jgi:AcrR family transcriptional regulator
MNNNHPSRAAASVAVPDAGEPLAAKSMGRRERRAAETRVRLFRCALQLFAERGFSNVTVEEITEAADVGKGTFFNYFESKDHVLGVMAEIQLGKVAEALALADQNEQPIQAVVRRLFLRAAEEPGRSPDLARALIGSFLASEGVRKLIARKMCEGRRMAAEIVAEGQKRGEIDPRLKKEKVAIQVLQTFMGTVLIWSLHEEPPLAAWMEDSFQHFWRSIASEG